MRYVFFSLLLGNLAYFLYAEFREPPAPTKSLPQAMQSGPTTLSLLLERKSLEVKSVETESMEAKSKETKSKETRGDRQKELESVVKKPQIQDEVKQEQKDIEGDEAPACKAIGPYFSLDKGQDAVAQLAELNLSVTLQVIDKATSARDFRLMIPPANSLQDAYRRQRELKSNNIESYVITQGKRKHGVSLGVFSTRQGAEMARKQLPDLGYSVELIEIPRIVREYWVIPRGSPKINLTAATWKSVTDEHPELRRQMMECIN